jgi:hypothetical protein
MKKLMLFAGACMAATLLQGTAYAESWSGSRTGPGGVSRSGTLTCGDHACGWNMQATGPEGATWSRRGGVVQGPNGGVAGFRAFTGPQGNTFVRGGWRR